MIRARTLWTAEPDLKRCVAFGLIMSLSILQGATGFHVYILIYFPFLAPLFAYRQLLVSPLLPIGFVLVLEGVMAVAT